MKYEKKINAEIKREKFLYNLWGKVENQIIFKILFVLLIGVCISLYFMLLYVLRDASTFKNPLKTKMIYLVTGFIIGIFVSPFLLKTFSKRYHEYKQK